MNKCFKLIIIAERFQRKHCR